MQKPAISRGSIYNPSRQQKLKQAEQAKTDKIVTKKLLQKSKKKAQEPNKFVFMVELEKKIKKAMADLKESQEQAIVQVKGQHTSSLKMQ